jgi:uncharacterized membrane protein YphA (DoxX/SURF4 family)
MERLYSQYPGGAVGLALLLLRIAIGSELAQDGISRWIANSSLDGSAIQIVAGALLVTLSLLLMFGVRTSAVAIAGAGLLVASELHTHISGGQSWFCLCLRMLVCASVALLGPGGYSLDARLWGWRSIDISSRAKN